MATKSARVAAIRPYEYQVSLRVRHPSMNPAQITQKLTLQPDHAWACGEPRLSESGQKGGVRRNSYWSATLPAPSADFLATLAPGTTVPGRLDIDPRRVSELIDAAWDLSTFLSLHLMQLKRQREFLQQLAAEGEVSLVIEMSVSTDAMVGFDPVLLRHVADLGLRLEFEFD